MNAHKHMEAIFGVALMIGCVVAVLPERAGTAAPAQGQASATPMPVVVIKAKRMTELEKRQSLEAGPGNRGAAAGA